MEGGIQPVMSLDGNRGYGDGWGNWGGALIGGALGGAVGGAWNGNRWNSGQCCNNGGAAAYGDLFLMDSVSNMRNEVGSVGRDQLMQTAGLQSTMCQGFGGVNAAVDRVGATLAQGQCRTEAAVLTTGLNGQIEQKNNTIATIGAQHAAEIQSMRNTFEVASKIDNCCCTTNSNIERQGCATREVLLSEGCATRAKIGDEGDKTRALIQAIQHENLMRDLNAKDAKIAQLEAQGYNSMLAAQTQHAIHQDMYSIAASIIGHGAAIANRPSVSNANAPAA